MCKYANFKHSIQSQHIGILMCDSLSNKNEPCMFAHKLKFLLFPQLIQVATHYTLKQLLMLTAFIGQYHLVYFSRVLFADHVNLQLVKQCLKLAVGIRYCSHCSISLFWPCSEILVHCQQMWMYNHSKLCHLCQPYSLFQLLPSPSALPTHSISMMGQN